MRERFNNMFALARHMLFQVWAYGEALRAMNFPQTILLFSRQIVKMRRFIFRRNFSSLAVCLR